MGEKEEEKRIQAPAWFIALLDDIRLEIVRSREVTEQMIPEGVAEGPEAPIRVTTQRTLVEPPNPDKPWFGVKIWNDGAHPLVAIVNPHKMAKRQVINPNDWWGEDFNTAVIKGVLLFTLTDESLARVTGVR